MTNWRFMINRDGSVTRGRLYRLPEAWASDAWENYWDGDTMVTFYDEGFRGCYAGVGDEDAERAIVAFTMHGDRDHDALDKVAARITGQARSRFVAVSLDRGTDFYALSWDGDPEGEWRREIESVYNGEIYRIECEDFDPDLGWDYAEEYGEEFYGEDPATAEFERVFDLPEFPAERFVTDAVGS